MYLILLYIPFLGRVICLKKEKRQEKKEEKKKRKPENKMCSEKIFCNFGLRGNRPF